MRQQSSRSGTYFPYSSVGRVVISVTTEQNWSYRWFFLGGAWEISTYGVAQVESHMPQVIFLPWWARIEKSDHPASKRVVDKAFTLELAFVALTTLRRGT